MSGRHLAAVDALRFSSALLVVAYHAGTSYSRAPSEHAAAALSGMTVPATMVGWSWWGWVGVELFFTISGLVIAASVLGAPAGDFLRRRVLRLLPAAWICATLTLVLLLLAGVGTGESLFQRWFAAMLLLPTGPWIDASFWTLAIECSFYLLVALSLGRAGRLERIEWIGVALTGWSAAFWCWALLDHGSGGTQLMHHRALQLLLLPNGAQFGLGIAIWALLHRGSTARRVLAAATAFGISGIDITCRAAERAQELGVIGGALMPLLVFSLGTAILLAAGRIQPSFSAPSTARSLAAMGLATYPLYLLHQDAGAVLLAAAMRAGIPGLAGALVSQAVIMVAAFAIARFAEPWVRQRLRRGLYAIAAQPAPWPRAR